MKMSYKLPISVPVSVVRCWGLNWNVTGKPGLSINHIRTHFFTSNNYKLYKCASELESFLLLKINIIPGIIQPFPLPLLLYIELLCKQYNKQSCKG